MPADQYNERVRALFAAPRHAGDASGPRADVARGGCRVVLTADVRDGQLERLAFRVFGCPHLVAAAEAFCDEFEGRAAAALAEFSVAAVMERLAVPVGKTGRILLLEDAVQALHRQLAATAAD